MVEKACYAAERGSDAASGHTAGNVIDTYSDTVLHPACAVANRFD